MNRFRPYILLVTLIFTSLVAFGVWVIPSPEPLDAEGFSSARVVKDIEKISANYHSVMHPSEKDSVGNYLVSRLEEIGADTVGVYEVADSLEFNGVTYDVNNIYAEFHPLEKTEDTTYLMLVAHYDSRYPEVIAKDTVCSYGAADNGYGLGVVLETVSQLKKHQQTWKQGVKVLFTDAEEVGMIGMKSQYKQYPEQFSNVGLLINVDARGSYGPVLLFETSPGNEKLIELYDSEACSPYAYSFASTVYEGMPNFTDFTVVKDKIPGLNFSTVADINHYHTDKDNFKNINEKTIQHYGAQLLPVVSKYLTEREYSDVKALVAEKDRIYFSIPLLGLFNFGRAGYLLLNIAVILVFCFLFALEGVRGRLKPMKVLKMTGIVFGTALGICALGELIAWITAAIAGVEFAFMGVVKGVGGANVITLLSIILMVGLVTYFYIRRRARAIRETSSSMRASAEVTAVRANSFTILYGTLSLIAVISVIIGSVLHENMMLLIPLTCATFAMVLSHLTNLRLWFIIAIVLIALHALSFIYVLSMAMTVGALGLTLMLAFFDLVILISLADIYMMPEKRR